jgi:hypothetical protein
MGSLSDMSDSWQFDVRLSQALTGMKLGRLFLKALLAACGKGAYYPLTRASQETPARRRGGPELEERHHDHG